MNLRFALSTVLTTTVFSASAMAFSANSLAPCVGKQFVQLQAAPTTEATHGTSSATCLTREHLSVCRTILEGDQPDNRTMKVTVSSKGVITQEWFESADPSYLKHVHAFVARDNKPNSPIVIATLQSESQGMGVQEWLVNAMTSSGRHTFTTSEFGATGSLVFDRKKSASACQILLTRWESRPTQDGERLFLVGTLVAMDADTAQGPEASPAISRRLDKRLERLRAMAPSDRPLSYFVRPVH